MSRPRPSPAPPRMSQGCRVSDGTIPARHSQLTCSRALLLKFYFSLPCTTFHHMCPFSTACPSQVPFKQTSNTYWHAWHWLLDALVTESQRSAPLSSSGGCSGSFQGTETCAAACSGPGCPAELRLPTMLRAMLMACSSLSARWSVTPEVLQCSCAPPKSSALTSSPVAACRHSQCLCNVTSVTANRLPSLVN